MSMLLRRRLMVQGGEPPGPVLPDTYSAVEWIKSDGGQYIDTGVLFNQGIKLIAEMGWHTEISGVLLGARTNTGSTRFLISYYNGKVDYGYGGDNLSGTPVLDEIYKMVFDTTVSGKFTYGLYGNENTKTASNISTNVNGYIFANHRASDDAVLSNSKATFKSLVITNAEETKLFDGVPCVRIADNKPGIYDFVSAQFLTNQGTGDFTIPQI